MRIILFCTFLFLLSIHRKVMLYEMHFVSYTETAAEAAEEEAADFTKTLISSLFFAPSSSPVHR